MEFKKTNDNLIDSEKLESLSKSFNLDKKIIQILYSRGYQTENDLKSFLFDDINNLKDPFLMLNMDKVVARILTALQKNEKILIFGDYDTDGIGAVSILYNFLKTKTENFPTTFKNRKALFYSFIFCF